MFKIVSLVAGTGRARILTAGSPSSRSCRPISSCRSPDRARNMTAGLQNFLPFRPSPCGYIRGLPPFVLVPACPVCLHTGSPDTRPLRGGHRPRTDFDRGSLHLHDRAGLPRVFTYGVSRYPSTSWRAQAEHVI
jgi:hypothetical protein